MNTATKQDYQLSLRTILHPTDFSLHSAVALQLAMSLANGPGCRLVLLHVLTPVVVADEMGSTVVPFTAGEREAVTARLRALAGTRAEAECRVEIGDPANVTVEVARELGSDLIVLGTHGRTGLGRLLLGSVAEQVVRKAPCPVITVKMPVPPEAPKSVPSEADNVMPYIS